MTARPPAPRPGPGAVAAIRKLERQRERRRAQLRREPAVLPGLRELPCDECGGRASWFYPAFGYRCQPCADLLERG